MQPETDAKTDETQPEPKDEPRDEITEFIRKTAASLREKAQALDPEGNPTQALETAIAAWQIVRAICDRDRLGIVAKDGVICGLAKIEPEAEPEDRFPEEI